MTLGKHLIKSWSSTQSTIALSSGEAEFYAIVEGASRALGVEALMDDMGMKGQVRIWSDSSAGRSISLRKGTGKMRHLQVKYLWLQDATFEKRLTVEKVKGTENPADVATKFLTATEINEVVKAFGVVMKIVDNVAKPESKTKASRGVTRYSDPAEPSLRSCESLLVRVSCLPDVQRHRSVDMFGSRKQLSFCTAHFRKERREKEERG